jgi:hypothetical protein
MVVDGCHRELISGNGTDATETLGNDECERAPVTSGTTTAYAPPGPIQMAL